jgi:rubrerythrin
MLEQLTLRKAIEFAVTTEDLGAKFYTRAAAKFEADADLGGIFAQLARDEEAHGRAFRALLDDAPKTHDDELDYERAQYLRAMALSEFFSSRGPFAKLAQVSDAASALRHAFEFEKAALGFYRALRDVLGPSKPLDAIIEMEKEHLARLLKVLATGARFRSLQDEWS